MFRVLFLVSVTLLNTAAIDYPDSYQGGYNKPSGYGYQNPAVGPGYGSTNNHSQNIFQQAGQQIAGTFGLQVNNTGVPPVTSGVYVKVTLRSYQNNDYRLSQTTSCSCPRGPYEANCITNSPQRNGYSCYFTFMVLVAAANGNQLYDSTAFVRVDTNGGVDPKEMNDFTRSMEFISAQPPSAITILVNHMGAVIDTMTGGVNQTNTFVNVDEFVVPLGNNTAYNQDAQVNLIGTRLQTSLSLTYSIGCRGTLLGPGCNYRCNNSAVNTQMAVCQEDGNGYYHVCRWLAGRNQVTECQPCPWGIKEDAYCRDADGNVLDDEHAGVVSSSFRTATIILGIVAGVLLILLLLALVVACVLRGRGNNQGSVPPGYRRTDQSGMHRGEPETRPLTAERPTPSPRNRSVPPPLTAQPVKPAIRSQYQFPPAAHLGGTASLNDTLDSSFAGSQMPGNVSRSADV